MDQLAQFDGFFEIRYLKNSSLWEFFSKSDRKLDISEKYLASLNMAVHYFFIEKNDSKKPIKIFATNEPLGEIW